VSTPPSLPPPDPDLELLISSVIVRSGDDTPTTIIAKNQPDPSVRVSWQTKLSMLSGAWRLNILLQSLTSSAEHALADLSVPVLPGSVSYTEEVKINVGLLPVDVYRLVTSVTYLDAKNSPVFVGYSEELIQIVSD